MKKVTPSVGRCFVCSKCDKATNGAKVVQREVICGELETTKGFCYLEDRLNASGGCEAEMTARTRVGWKKLRECGEILAVIFPTHSSYCSHCNFSLRIETFCG